VEQPNMVVQTLVSELHDVQPQQSA